MSFPSQNASACHFNFLVKATGAAEPMYGRATYSQQAEKYGKELREMQCYHYSVKTIQWGHSEVITNGNEVTKPVSFLFPINRPCKRPNLSYSSYASGDYTQKVCSVCSKCIVPPHTKATKLNVTRTCCVYLFINDSEEVTQCSVKFTDDTKLVAPIDMFEGRTAIQTDLQQSEEWHKSDLMKFSRGKSIDTSGKEDLLATIQAWN